MNIVGFLKYLLSEYTSDFEKGKFFMQI